MFDELTALTSLWLRDNSLTELPDDVFDELTALTSLRLHNNSLTELPDDVFDELTALTRPVSGRTIRGRPSRPPRLRCPMTGDGFGGSRGRR